MSQISCIHFLDHENLDLAGQMSLCNIHLILDDMTKKMLFLFIIYI